MRRLLWKEIRASLWITIGVAVAGLVLVARGHHLFFIGDTQGGETAWLILPFFISGLRAFSGELAGETVQFLYARPVKWWQIWLSKVLAGPISIGAVLVLVAVVYSILLPAQYRPFLPMGLLKGLGLGLGEMALAYLAGFIFSILAPGSAPSFAVMVGFMGALTIPFTLLEQIAGSLRWKAVAGFIETTFLWVATFGAVGVFVSSIIVARKLASMTVSQRWRLWAVAPLAGILLGFVAAGINNSISRPPWVLYRTDSVSPDGRWVVYVREGDEPAVFVNTQTGDRLHARVSWPQGAGHWSNDSRRYAIMEAGNRLLVMSPDEGKPDITRIDLSAVPDLPGTIHLSWSPDGRRIAVAGHEYVLAIVTPADSHVRRYKTTQVSLQEAFSMPAGKPVVVRNGETFWPQGWTPLPSEEPRHAQ